MDRKAQLLGDATTATRILEIGPSHAPIAPKRDGWNSYVVDHADQDGLRAKYAAMGVNTDGIEKVDAVWAGGRLDAAIPAAEHGSFGRLIASHVIEHIPDPVTLLISAQTILAPGGVISFAVPDKRYCFDVFKPHSTTGDLLASHNPFGPGRHTARTLFHMAAYSAEGQFPDGRFLGAWGQHPVAQTRLTGSLESGFAEAARAHEPGYIDAHAWHFTPCAFELAILELAEAGLIDWHVAEITGAYGAEFFVLLKRGRATWPSTEAREQRRLQLLLGILAELREQIDWMGLGGLLTRPSLPADPAIARHLANLEGAQAAYLARLDNDAIGIRAQLDGLQQVVASIVGADGTQASIMGSLAQLAARQADQQALIDTLAQQLAAQNRMLASLTAPDGTQASLMGSLELVATRQQQHAQAIDGAAHQALEAARMLHVVSGRLDAQQHQLNTQNTALAAIHTTTSRLDRLLSPFLRLRSLVRKG